MCTQFSFQQGKTYMVKSFQGGMVKTSAEKMTPVFTQTIIRDPSEEKKEEIPSVLAKAKTSPQGGEEKEKKRSRAKASQPPNTDYTPGFNKFWALYQRKERKVDAFEIWRTRDLDARAPEIADKIARLQVTLWRHKEVQYIPLPTTWLNEARYEDDLVPLDTAPTGGQQPQALSWAEQQRQREVQAARTFAGVPNAGPTGPTTIRDSDDSVIEGVTYHRVNDGAPERLLGRPQRRAD
jgi:hypothetical protein